MPKLSDVRDKAAIAPVPVPEKATVCGLPPALSVIARLADLAPIALGLKTILMLQLLPRATDVPQLLVWLKSLLVAPVMEIPKIVRAAFPLLVSVTLCAVLELPTG